MSSFRMFRDFVRLQKWERDILKRDDLTEGIILRTVRAVPWTGVGAFFFIMIFFGVDLGAGVKNTANQIREKKSEAVEHLQKVQARQWSMDQVKTFRDDGSSEVTGRASEGNVVASAARQEAKKLSK